MKRAPALCASACAVALLLPSRAIAAPATDEPVATTPTSGPATTSPVDREPSRERVLDDDKVYEALVREFTRNWQEGERQYQRKQFEQAARAFERAYAAMPFADALYNALIAYEEALDDVSAALAAQRYLQLPNCQEAGVDASRCASKRTEVEQRLQQMRARVVEVQFDATTGVQLREIRINGRSVRPSAFPMLVEPGTMEIELIGRESWQRVLRERRLKPGETYVIRPTPFRAAPEPPRTTENGPVKPVRQRNTKALKAAFWGGVGFTAASGVALTTMGTLSLVERRKYEDGRCPMVVDPPGSCAYPQDHDDRSEQYKLSTNILIGVTAGLATITAILGVVAFRRRKPQGGNQRASTRVRLRPHVGGLSIAF